MFYFRSTTGTAFFEGQKRAQNDGFGSKSSYRKSSEIRRGPECAEHLPRCCWNSSRVGGTPPLMVWEGQHRPRSDKSRSCRSGNIPIRAHLGLSRPTGQTKQTALFSSSFNWITTVVMGLLFALCSSFQLDHSGCDGADIGSVLPCGPPLTTIPLL